MKNLLLTSALVALTTTGSFAQETNWEETFLNSADAMEIRASDFIGKRVYISEIDLADDQYTEASQDWDDVGEINDVLLGRDGTVEAILVDVGGFLGLGEKTVAVQMAKLNLVTDVDDQDDYFVVFTSSQTVLEQAPEYSDDMMNHDVVKSDGDAFYPAAPMIDRDGYEAVVVADMTAEDLDGAPVYDANDEWIGEVSELIVSTDGVITEAVIDVGGFLGLGEKPVAMEFDGLTVLRDSDGEDLRIYVAATQEQLESMPAYEHQ